LTLKKRTRGSVKRNLSTRRVTRKFIVPIRPHIERFKNCINQLTGIPKLVFIRSATIRVLFVEKPKIKYTHNRPTSEIKPTKTRNETCIYKTFNNVGGKHTQPKVFSSAGRVFSFFLFPLYISGKRGRNKIDDQPCSCWRHLFSAP
jgi:hypothetical protein